MNSKNYKKLLFLMKTRGYKIDDKKYSKKYKEDYYETFEKIDQKAGVMYIESDKNKERIGAESLRKFYLMMLNLNVRRGVLVSKYPLGTKSNHLIELFKDYVSMELITLQQLNNPIPEYCLSRSISKVDDPKRFCLKYKIGNPKNELMKLYKHDPVCVYYELEEEDIVIVKDDQTITYAVVCKI